MARSRNYTIPEGNYTVDFLRALAIVAHKRLIEPEELKFWFYDEKLSQKEIFQLMQNKIDGMRNEN